MHQMMNHVIIEKNTSQIIALGISAIKNIRISQKDKQGRHVNGL